MVAADCKSRPIKEAKMKLTQNDLDRMARKITFELLSTAGLKNAKKIASIVKRNLLAEDKRRKNLKEKK